ncbi:hypothetical protein HID58_046070, partial [Brassica napus]
TTNNVSRKLTAAEKGKGVATAEKECSRKRIRAPRFDNSALIQRNLQTLIGHDCPSLPRRSSLREVSPEERHEARATSNGSSYYRKDPRYQPYPSASLRSISNKETTFNQRLDRHGRPFGERISLSQNQAMPLRNKITPALVERQSQRQNQQDGVRAQMHREGELEDHTYRRHSRSYQTSKALPTNAASSQMIWREKRDSPR